LFNFSEYPGPEVVFYWSISGTFKGGYDPTPIFRLFRVLFVYYSFIFVYYYLLCALIIVRVHLSLIFVCFAT